MSPFTQGGSGGTQGTDEPDPPQQTPDPPAPAGEESNTKTYTLGKDSQAFYAKSSIQIGRGKDAKTYTEGDEVQLTDEQAELFRNSGHELAEKK